MLEVYKPEIAREILLSHIHNRFFPEKDLERLAKVVLQSTNVTPFVYGFIIPSALVSKGNKGYFFAISSKIPTKNRLMVSYNSFDSLEACCFQCAHMIQYFPLFGFSKRYLYWILPIFLVDTALLCKNRFLSHGIYRLDFVIIGDNTFFVWHFGINLSYKILSLSITLTLKISL